MSISESQPETRREFRYRAPLLDWWLLLTDGFRKGRLVVEKDAQTLPKVKRWVSQSVAPMLAVICAEHPGRTSLVGKANCRRRETMESQTSGACKTGLNGKGTDQFQQLFAGENAGAPSQGGEGVSSDSPCCHSIMLLTIKDLSAWLNIKPSTLYLWAAQGKSLAKRSMA